MPLSIVEQYHQMIQHLDNADKMILVEKIINSVNNPPKSFNHQFNSWQNNQSADDMIADIEVYTCYVILEKDIDEYSSLDYLAVSDDKTNKDWFAHFLVMTEQASQNIATHLPQNERGWTRDELYER